jgi:hypothetical protein
MSSKIFNHHSNEVTKMQINTTGAFAAALLSAIIGFGISYLIQKRIQDKIAKKSQNILLWIASLLLGFGLMSFISEIISLPLQGLNIRYDKLMAALLVNVIFLPLFFGFFIWLLQPTRDVEISGYDKPIDNMNEIQGSERGNKRNIVILAAIILIIVIGMPLVYYFGTTRSAGREVTFEKTKSPNINNDKPAIVQKIDAKACIFLWDDNRSDFTSLQSTKNLDSYERTYIYIAGKESYADELAKQLETAASKNQHELAKKIAKELGYNVVYIFYPKSLTSDFIVSLAGARDLKYRCN